MMIRITVQLVKVKTCRQSQKQVWVCTKGVRVIVYTTSYYHTTFPPRPDY